MIYVNVTNCPNWLTSKRGGVYGEIVYPVLVSLQMVVSLQIFCYIKLLCCVSMAFLPRYTITTVSACNICGSASACVVTFLWVLI